MPLNNKPPEQWHWTQAIAWIAFGIESPARGDILKNDFHKTIEVDLDDFGSVQAVAGVLANDFGREDLKTRRNQMNMGHFWTDKQPD